ncbi:MFS transporter [Janthinobacterium lividum]|uniref:MFS transporter n=1 Tax=Janthinobacterium lividum TaxID=29581 RepID=UPI000874EAEA|nr:MFS transporter [Janthinobacterium lividum]MCC7714039.1 MFS transporter [Janthinobacterium lividum]OEZ65627.1 purine efflux pump PbuE [Janthinobacterium lividum]WQE28024.1 MFS transporter [Janthinobacterium lividum]STQ98954.1 Purine efflux pump PbuE [Janthinobacterium lividum]
MSDSSSSSSLAPAIAALPATVYLIAMGAFALGMASYVTAGLMPMIASAFSISLAMAAQLVTAFTLAYGLGSPLVVALLPARAQRSGLLIALAVFVLANGASALAPGFSGLLAWRAIAGVGAGVYLALGIAAAAGVSAPQQRGKAIGVIMGGMAGGTVLGVPLSLLLAQQLDWTAALWLVAVLGGLALAGLLWKLPALPAVPATSLRRKLVLLADGQVLSILLVSLLAAIASLGMYTFIAPLLAWSAQGAALSTTPFLWAWGVGGIAGSVLVGPWADKVAAPKLTCFILLLLALALCALPLAAGWSAWLMLAPIALWGAAGWALQVPQNQQLLAVRARQGDGNLAIALNESALYLGSAIGAATGGVLLLLDWPMWLLAAGAALVAAAALLLQLPAARRT